MVLGRSSPKMYSLSEMLVVRARKQVEFHRGVCSLVLGHSSPKIYSLSEMLVVRARKQVEIIKGGLFSGFRS